MSLSHLAKCSSLAVLAGSFSLAQAPAATTTPAALVPQSTLPVGFSKALDANSLKAGDPIEAKTVQEVRLANGEIVKPGAKVIGHVVEATPFRFDKTPYATQKQGVLSLQFDKLVTRQGDVPLHASLRAIADRFASEDATRPRPSDEDSLHSTTQVGGDIVTPSQKEIVSRDGDTVGYNKRGGSFAHLIANGPCDGGNTEQPVAIFSASACGAYGFVGMALNSSGPIITFVSNHRAPAIPQGSSALLETQPDSTVAEVR